MKKSAIVAAACVLTLGIIGTSGAVPVSYTDSMDWDAKGSRSGRTWERIKNPSYSFRFSDFELPQNSMITQCELILTHRGNKAKPKREFWTLHFHGKTFGLEPSRWTWINQHISLDPNLLAEGVNSLIFSLVEYTPGRDSIRLDKALFSIEYSVAESSPAAPIPEPATMLLFGCGLLSLAGSRRKFKRES